VIRFEKKKNRLENDLHAQTLLLAEKETKLANMTIAFERASMEVLTACLICFFFLLCSLIPHPARKHAYALRKFEGTAGNEGHGRIEKIQHQIEAQRS
jgi:hypothetical protein